jgi:hypothetical protein
MSFSPQYSRKYVIYLILNDNLRLIMMLRGGYPIPFNAFPCGGFALRFPLFNAGEKNAKGGECIPGDSCFVADGRVLQQQLG